jgi:phage host-nuclease inhibitor protein Gam
MGSGVVAKGAINETQTFAMLSMLGEIDDLEAQLQDSMKSIISANSSKYDSTVKRNLTSVKKAIAEYTSLTKESVLKGGKGLNADDYFMQGTDIISTLINIFNSNNRAIIEDSKGWI